MSQNTLTFPTSDAGEPDWILTADGLTKSFRGFVAVKDVDLRIRRHTIHALIGPNGAGKTTCFNLLTKFLEPSAGTIRFNGRDICRESPSAVARQGLVRSFQISAVFPHLTVLQNVRVALQRGEGIAHQFWQSSRVLARLTPRAEKLLEAVDLLSMRDLPAAQLSYGRKRALEIATTLALEPELMLLDEPMAGMGHEDVARVTELIRRVAQGRTIVMVEHNLGVVASLCDRISVLRRGEILTEGSYDEVSGNPEVIEAYMGVGNA